ncbi:GMPPB [Enterospora canceri]|uniref:mannose-1-phosphate guanylyltransferase n=1 Tax=Enterospora canceri TaxID=1081671 RepID=A0A1Y1S9X7_9MICR|nr:GMPPB [Enterospora canceri]
MEVNTAVLLVGGKGSRLYPLTATRPKPLVPFLNKPIIEYQIEILVKTGIKKIILALNYFSEQIKAKALLWEQKYGIEVIYSKEGVPLGTAGPLKLAERHISGDGFIVFNTDIYAFVELDKMIGRFVELNETGKCVALIMTTDIDDPTRFGLIKTDGDRVVEFIEKPDKYTGNINTINAGMYVFSREILNKIHLRETSIEKEIFPEIAEAGHMRIFNLDGIWCDIGVPREYLNGQKMALELSGDSGRNVVLGQGVEVADGVELENCVLLDNVVVEKGCVIKNALIGKGCVIKANTIINDEETLVLKDNTVYPNECCGGFCGCI